jgi:glycosyltransferase involved in cell wall biosynthesis
MSKRKNLPLATVDEKEIVLDRGGRFSLNLPAAKEAPDVFLVLDIYNLDQPEHPKGHLGWWRYELAQLPRRVAGNLFREPDGSLQPAIDGAAPVDAWRNPVLIDVPRMELLVVLRSAITNAILSIDRVPVTRSEHDLETFRSGFDRNYQSPRYAPQHYLMPPDRQVHIVSKHIYQRDAVGDLCLALYRMLRQQHVATHLFADSFDLAMNDLMVDRESLSSRVGPDDVVIYFFSTYDDDLDEIVKLQCASKIAYFHGITPPNLLQVFDPELSAVCARATAQIALLWQFDCLVTNSGANAAQLREAAENDHLRSMQIEIIPPKIFPERELELRHFGPKPSPATFLYVGRVISHKRIEDILHLLARYRLLDPSARCKIVGLADNFAYRDYLRWVQTEKLNLPEDAVIWVGSVSEHDLAEIYNEATVYLSMSEHEGFCLPLLEAMMHDVLVFAYDRPAVREVVGGAGVLFADKSFDTLASQLHLILESPETCRSILDAQRMRATDYLRKMDGRSFLELIAKTDQSGRGSISRGS